jgi:hypothetical protein
MRHLCRPAGFAGRSPGLFGLPPFFVLASLAGGLLGLLGALRRDGAVAANARPGGRGLPLFRLPPLERAALPTLAHWQRIETLRRFRAGDRDERSRRGIHLTINGIAAGLRNSG